MAQYGSFEYPPPGSNQFFDYDDSVVASWEASQDNSTACRLMLYTYLRATDGPWISGAYTPTPFSRVVVVDTELHVEYNATVSCKGSNLVPLNIASDAAFDMNKTDTTKISQAYIGQFNLFYTTNEGETAKFLSPFFEVQQNLSSVQRTWALPSATSSSASSTRSSSSRPASATQSPASDNPLPSSVSASTTTEVGAGMVTAWSQTTTASAPPGGLVLDPGAIAGVSVGAVGAVALVAVLMWLLRRKMSKKPRKDPPASSTVKAHEMSQEGMRRELANKSLPASPKQHAPSAGLRSELMANEPATELSGARWTVYSQIGVPDDRRWTQIPPLDTRPERARWTQIWDQQTPPRSNR